jgi:hypothetical protein
VGSEREKIDGRQELPLRGTSAHPLSFILTRNQGSSEAVFLTSVGLTAVSGVVALRDGHGARMGPRAGNTIDR